MLVMVDLCHKHGDLGNKIVEVHDELKGQCRAEAGKASSRHSGSWRI